MSNYPPGVSGHEWQIAGPAYEVEREEQRDVEHDECSVLDGEGSGFSGEVAALVTDFGPGYTRLVEWTCPRCGTMVEQEEEWEED